MARLTAVGSTPSTFKQPIKEEVYEDCLRATVASTLSGTLGHVTSLGKSIFRGGRPKAQNWVKQKELEAVKSFIDAPEQVESLTVSEYKKINGYFADLERSLELNKKIPLFKKCKIETEQQELELLTQDLFTKIQQLKAGESFYLDYSHFLHAMILSIKAQKEGIRICLMNTSGRGSEEILKINKKIPGDYVKKAVPRNHTAIEVVIASEVFATSGLKYLERLFLRMSPSNVEHDKKVETVDVKKNDTVAKDRAILAKNQRTLDAFMSFSEAKMVPVVQTAQTTGNCFAKRIQANELHALGRPLYKKFRRHYLQEQRKAMLEDLKNSDFVSTKFAQELRGLPEKILNSDQLAARAVFLKDLEHFPSEAYFLDQFKNPQILQKYLYAYKQTSTKEVSLKSLAQWSALRSWQSIFEVLNHNIAKLKIKRVFRDTELPVLKYSGINSLTEKQVETAVLLTLNRGKEKIYQVQVTIDGKPFAVEITTFLTWLQKHKEYQNFSSVVDILQFLKTKTKRLSPDNIKRLRKLTAGSK